MSRPTLRGLGLRKEHYADALTPHQQDVDWFEVISENFMFSEGNPLETLEAVRARFPLALHGVSLGIGNLEPISIEYLSALKRLIARFDPFVVSDHLCWTRHKSHNSHDLLPVPLTSPALTRITERVQMVQEFLGRTIALENPSAYASFSGQDWGEAEFMAELCKRTGCRVLLDVNNLFVNFSNLRTNISNYFEWLRPDDVCQFHIAGHSIVNHLRIDTHDHSPSVEALQLLALARQRWPKVPVLLEWDDKIPSWPELVNELDRVMSFQSREDGPPEFLKATTRGCAPLRAVGGDQTVLQHDDFFAMSTSFNPIASANAMLKVLDDSLPVSREQGINVYQNAYWARLIGVMEDIFSLTKKALGEADFYAFCRDYISSCPSSYPSISMIGVGVRSFLELKNTDSFPRISVLLALTDFEWRKWQLFSENSKSEPLLSADVQVFGESDWEKACFGLAGPSYVSTYDVDLAKVLQDLEHQSDFSIDGNFAGTTRLLLWREDRTNHWRFLDHNQHSLVKHLIMEAPIRDCFENFDEPTSAQCLAFLFELIEHRAICRID
jgi:uncharacterized protein (UPF0276 family)